MNSATSLISAITCEEILKTSLLDLRRASCRKPLGTGQTHSERSFLRVLVLGVCPKSGSQRDAGPAMGLADNTVGLDAGKRTLLSNSHRKTNCSLGPLFSFEDFNLGDQLHSISRRTFLSLGLSIPLLARSGSNQDDKQTPISMSRCLWLTDGPDSAQRVFGGDSCGRLRESTLWRCEMIAGDSPMKDWWLLVVQHQNTDPLLKVLQPSSAIPDSPQLLAARITFRLHVLQRRGFGVESLSKRQLVSVVNQLIRNAIKKMPA